MYPIPELPSMAQIRSAADKALAEVGFKRIRGVGYVRQIDEDFSLSVSPNGNIAGQSTNIGAIYRPACATAADIWSSLSKNRSALFEGVAGKYSACCTGIVRDEQARQRSWHFCKISDESELVSVEEFGEDLAKIAERHVRRHPDITTAITNPEMDMTNPAELRATVHAMLGDADGFTRTAAPILAHMDMIKLELEARKQTVASEFTPDFAAYFDAVRARFLTT